MIKRLYTCILFQLASLAIFPLSSTANSGASLASEIAQIEIYLNELQTIEASFLQVNPDGSFAKGKLYVKRPGHMRVDYDPPVPVQLYANNNILTLVDSELKEVSNYPLDETPANILLQKAINLNDGLTIQEFKKKNLVVRIKLTSNQNPDIGSLILTLATRPLQLQAWTVIDAQGLKTEFALVNARFGGEINPSIFHFVNTFGDPG